MNEYVLAAFLFGVTSGFKPGPLGIVVIQQTLQHGLRHGLKACLAPLITDGPIILAASLLLHRIEKDGAFIGLLSLAGGIYLLRIAYKIARLREIRMSEMLDKPTSLQTAITVNLLSPSPYLFWFTVGGTYLTRGTVMEATAFVVVAIGTLVLSKMATAWIAAYSRAWLDSRAYVRVMWCLGAMLAAYGGLFLIRGGRILLQ